MSPIESTVLIISVLINFITATFSAYARARSKILTSKTQTNRKIQMLENVVLVFMEAKNYDEAKMLAKEIMIKFEQNDSLNKTQINEKGKF